MEHSFEAAAAGEDHDERTLGDRARSQSSRPQVSDDALFAGTSISWTPSASARPEREAARAAKKAKKQAASETFGMGLSKGAGVEQGYGVEALSEQARSGRKERRKPTRSASKNAMRAATSGP